MNDVLPLETPEQPNPPPRPKLGDPGVRRRAAEMAAESIDDANWWQGEMEDREWVNDLEYMIQERDGFRACRRLQDRHGWDPDSELVEILDYPWLDSALNDAVREWVNINGIRPHLAVWDTVVVKGHKEYVGVIIKIQPNVACYTVEFDGGKYTASVPYEDVSAVSSESSAVSGSV